MLTKVMAEKEKVVCDEQVQIENMNMGREDEYSDCILLYDQILDQLEKNENLLEQRKLSAQLDQEIDLLDFQLEIASPLQNQQVQMLALK